MTSKEYIWLKHTHGKPKQATSIKETHLSILRKKFEEKYKEKDAKD